MADDTVLTAGVDGDMIPADGFGCGFTCEITSQMNIDVTRRMTAAR